MPHNINAIIVLCSLLVITIHFPGCDTSQERKKSGKQVVDTSLASDSTTAAVEKSTHVPSIFQMALDGDITGVSTMLDQGAPVNATDPKGRTPLMPASFNGHVEIVNRLLAAGAKVNTRDAIGRTALMYGSSGPFPSVVALLCKHGAEVNIVDTQERWTALMFAAAEGHRENVRILLDNKADPSLKDSDGDNAAAFALQKGFKDIAIMLKRYSPAQ